MSKERRVNLDGSKTAEPAPVQLSEAEEKARIATRLRKFITDADEVAQQKLLLYYFDLIKFNRALNLVSGTGIKLLDTQHFADSAYASKLIVKNLVSGSPLFDVGSGNGFPGLIISILNPELKVVLMDRDKRKVEFLKHMVSALELKNASTDSRPVEELPAKSIVNLVSRGFAPLHRALLLTRKQVKMSGRYFHMKGDGWANELAAVPSQLFSYWTPSLLGQYRIPESTADMAVVMTEKTAD